MARRGGGVPWHVGRDDGGDDAALPGADAVALPPGRPRPDDLARGRGLFRRLDRVRIGPLSPPRPPGARPPAPGRRPRPPRRPRPAHRLAAASPPLPPRRTPPRPHP